MGQHDVLPEGMPWKEHITSMVFQPRVRGPEMGHKETSDGPWLIALLPKEVPVFFFFFYLWKTGKDWETVQDYRTLRIRDNLMQCMILDWFLDQKGKRGIVDIWCLWIGFCDLDGSLLLMLISWLGGLKRCYIWASLGKIHTGMFGNNGQYVNRREERERE